MILFITLIWLSQTTLSQFSYLEIGLNLSGVSVVDRDIESYSENAKIIVIGKVTEVGDPYFMGSITPLQDATLEIEEVLKGDNSMKEIIVGRIAEQIEVSMEEQNNLEKLQDSLKGKEGILKHGERVLLFLAESMEGGYMIYGLNWGKFLIDESNNVSSVGSFRMSLREFKKTIVDLLEN